MTRKQTSVPDNLMIPLGAQATRELKKCADSWTDSDICLYRARLPIKYHAVPIDECRRLWINIRKSGTLGYKVNGHGPGPGSRKKAKRQKSPSWYQKYLDSSDWKRRRTEWLEFWGYRCTLCYVHQDEAVLDVHHRTYERLHQEQQTDCIVLCRRCHTLFEEEVPVSERSLF